MSGLHKLPNGSWIRLEDIRAIEPISRRATSHVHIQFSNYHYRLPFATYEDATRYADELAGQVMTAVDATAPREQSFRPFADEMERILGTGDFAEPPDPIPLHPTDKGDA